MHQQVPSQLPPHQPQVPPQGWAQQGYTPRPRRSRYARIYFWVFAVLQLIPFSALLGAGTQQTYPTTVSIFEIWAAMDAVLAIGFWLWRQTGTRP
jgi:hypothetical protein